MGWCLMGDCWVGQEEGLGHPVFLFHYQILDYLLVNTDSNAFINLLASQCYVVPSFANSW